MPPTFLALGHGPPKVTDDLYIWLVARDVPSDKAAARAVAAPPPGLADWIRPTDRSSGGTLQWTGPVLCLYTGYGVPYYAQALDPEHLAWLPEGSELSDADIERVLEEVMDDTGKGPRTPKDEAWALFGAQLSAWFQAVHQATPLWMAVVGRKVKPPGTALHRAAVAWAATHIDAVEAKSAALRDAHGTSYPTLGWTKPMARAVLAHTPAKDLSEAERWSLLRALDGAGMAPDAQGTALLNAWPKKARVEVLAQLLREGHDLGLLWLTGRSTHTMLLDDRVAEAAAEAPRGLLSSYLVDQARDRYYTPKKGIDRDAWLSRFVAAATPFAHEHIEGPAQAQPDNRGLQSRLSDWRALQELVS